MKDAGTPRNNPDPFEPEMLEFWARHPEFSAAVSGMDRCHVEVMRLLRRWLGLHFTRGPIDDRSSEAWRKAEQRSHYLELAYCHTREEIQNSAAFLSLTPAQRAAIEAECFQVPFTIEEVD